MVSAQTVYGTDIVLPGMLFASVERRPLAENRLQALDDSGAKAVTGVVDVVAIDSGVAVLANSTWAAIQGRNRLRVKWDKDKRPGSDNASYRLQLAEAIKQQGEVANRKGNVKHALRKATNVIESVYETGFLAHATLEPMNCTARVNGGRCDVWVGTQSQESARDTAARISGLPKNKTYIHSLFIGGGFGRRLESDFVADAVELAKRTNKPVQVLWSRADDMQHDFYRPAHMTIVKAALDQQGWPEIWWQRGAGSAMALDMVQVPYAISNFTDERVVVESPLPVGAWRSVAAGQSAFVVESFIDELAHVAGRDPLEYRFQLLSHDPRSANVLRHAADRAGWHVKLPAGHFQGVAFYQCFGSWVAQVAELSVDQDIVTIHRIVCAVDCGQTANPDAVCAQMEGAIAMGLSAAFKEQVLFRDGRVTQASLDDYPILSFAELPEIDVHIVPSHEPPGGAGEPGLPPLAPAVANAIFAATGKRFRALPFPLTIVK
jgi:isoquinoline 1-oxidoreductase beta subunit